MIIASKRLFNNGSPLLWREESGCRFMMAGLFLLFFVSMLLIFKKMHGWAITIALITLLLCICMFMHHVTDIIPIRL